MNKNRSMRNGKLKGKTKRLLNGGANATTVEKRQEIAAAAMQDTRNAVELRMGPMGTVWTDANRRANAAQRTKNLKAQRKRKEVEWRMGPRGTVKQNTRSSAKKKTQKKRRKPPSTK